ncbi:hypothetical protein [Glutamicibacter halophytocola]|uniref:hypothetical protein n=1 Tax=Glutamicibacter halophytocola TaxID=1933880 RepID=UPI0015C570B1|nr:hypothetical protein [Glutamicibacter halophytocola]NQD40565.1 hypothetical protein [Glutamicibacter halophytocola]
MAMTTQDTLTLGEARRLMNEAIEAVCEASDDYRDSERDPEQGSYSRSQTYATLLWRLSQYESAASRYRRILTERVNRA